MNNAIKLAYEIGDKIASTQGVVLIDVQYVKENGENYLRLFIDKPEGGIGIDECEVFSNAFSEEYDKVDPITDAYFLEISSPGVDRTLKTEREFNFFLGKDVAVKLYRTVDGRKEFEGTLKGYEDGNITVEVSGVDVNFTLKDSAYVKLLFNF